MLNSESLMVQTHDLVPVTPQSPREQFLRFHLAPHTNALLPIQQTAEVITIPMGQIVSIPHMPAWVMGVYNWRSEILWMVDLGQLCGLPPWYEQATNISPHKAIVLRSQDTSTTFTKTKSPTLGLVVDQVEGIEWCDIEMIQDLQISELTPELANFLRGYWWKSDDEMLAVLDGAAIFRAMPKQ